MRPGCFGSAVAFSTEAPACVSCPHSSACSDKAYDSVVKLSQRAVGVSVLLAEHCRFRTLTNKSLLSYAADPADRQEIKVKQRYRAERANFALSLEEQNAIEAIPVVKARSEVERLVKRGLHVLHDLRAGVNPISKPAYLNVACQFLVDNGHVGKQELADAYEAAGMARSSARSQASIAFAVLTYFGVYNFEESMSL